MEGAAQLQRARVVGAAAQRSLRVIQSTRERSVVRGRVLARQPRLAQRDPAAQDRRLDPLAVELLGDREPLIGHM